MKIREEIRQRQAYDSSNINRDYYIPQPLRSAARVPAKIFAKLTVLLEFLKHLMNFRIKSMQDFSTKIQRQIFLCRMNVRELSIHYNVWNLAQA